MSDLSISKSVGRAFEILEHFRQAREPRTVRSLEKALKYPYSSIRAITKNLTELGYLIYDARNRTYFPTHKLLGLIEGVEGVVWDWSGLSDIVEDLALRTNESTALSSRNFIFCNFLRARNGSQPRSHQYPIGVGLLLTNSVIGRVILSQMPEKETERLIKYTKYWTEMTNAPAMAHRDDIMSGIATARREGYLAAYGVWVKGTGTIAYPIPAAISKTPLVISVSGPAERIRKNESSIRRALESALKTYMKVGR